MRSLALALALALATTVAAAVAPSTTASSTARPSGVVYLTAIPLSFIDPRGVAVAAGVWTWPVSGPHSIARPFIAPATPYSSGHRGIDIRAPSPEVFAPEDGVVSFAGMVAGRPVLSIRHPGGLVSSFEPVSAAMPAGSVVSRGQLVGTLLPGHCSSVPCLHFGVRLDGGYVSPLNYLGGIPLAVLLPTR